MFNEYKDIISSNERIYFVMKRLVQMIKIEQFVRDDENNIYYIDDIIPQYLNRYSSCKIDLTDYFFTWYIKHYKHEFESIKPILNIALKTIHLFLSCDDSLPYFPLVNINKNIVAHPDGYYDIETKKVCALNDFDKNTYVIQYHDIPLKNNPIPKKKVSFSDDLIYHYIHDIK
jgi:hypothetical protein